MRGQSVSPAVRACGVAGDDGRLQRVEAAGAAKLARAGERLQPAADLELIPECAVLVEQEDRLARRVGARRRARGVQLHQGQQSVRFGLVRRDRGEHTAHAQRLVAELGAQPVLAARRGVAFVEDEIDDLQHRGEPLGERLAARGLIGQARVRQGPLGAHDALGDGRVGQQEGPGDLLGGQAADHPQRQRGARLARQQRMAGGEDQPQHLVADVVVQGGVRDRAWPAAPPPGPARASRACARACGRGADDPAPGAWRSPSARRRVVPERRSRASARARRAGLPASAPRPAARRAASAPGW